jgi:hypothetical protein
MDMQRRDGGLEGASDLLGGWLTRAEIAAEVGVSVDTLQRWHSRRIGPPCVRIGRKVLYRADAFRDWLVAQERGPVASKRGGAGR